MSFILDALRKSENERRQQATPALAAAPQAAAMKKRSLWVPVLVVVLVLNAIIFITMFLTRDEPAPVAATTPIPATPVVRSLRKELLAGATTAEPTRAPGTTTPTNRAASATPAAPVVKTPAVAPAPPPAETIQEGLPSLGQLKAAGLVSVAELRVDMHVYAGDAAKRFVFINMKKYREGERLVEGPTIEQITPDGVIMVQQGNRFRLDRD